MAEHLVEGDISSGNSGWTTSQKIGLEAAQLWHGIGSGVKHAAHDRFVEHPVSTAFDAVASAVAGVGLSSLAYHNPRTAIVVGMAMKAMMALDLASRLASTAYAGFDTWQNPTHYARNEKFAERQLGYGIVDYSVMGLSGALGYHYSNKEFSTARAFASGLSDAFTKGSGDIPKLEVTRFFEHPMAKFQALDDSTAARIYTAQQPAIVQVDIDYGDRGSNGTGFVVDGERGWIATNWHVGNARGSVSAITPDGTVSSLEFLAGDKQSDLAIYKTSKKPLSPWQEVELGNSNSLKPGDNLYGIGHPAGVVFDVLTSGKFERFIKTSPIVPTDNPPTIARIIAKMPQLGGSSGTPIFDETGKVVAVLNSGIGNSRAGATSVEHLDALLTALRAGEQARPRYGWLDVDTDITDAPTGKLKAPFMVHASVQPRLANAPIEELSKYAYNPPGLETIYRGLFQPAIGIPAVASFVGLMPFHKAAS